MATNKILNTVFKRVNRTVIFKQYIKHLIWTNNIIVTIFERLLNYFIHKNAQSYKLTVVTVRVTKMNH